MECINQLTKEDVIQAANDWIFNNSTRRAVFLMICSEQHVEPMKVDINNMIIGNENLVSDISSSSISSPQSNTTSSRALKFHNHYSLLLDNETIRFNSLDDLTYIKSSLAYP